jgi:hypothetical protein
MKIKFKKLISVITTFVLCVSLFTANVSAYGSVSTVPPQTLDNITPVSLSPSLFLPNTSLMTTMSTNSQNSLHLGDPNFDDEYHVSWRGNLPNGGTTNYYTNYRVSIADLYVTSSTPELAFYSYTNHNGTYYSDSSYIIEAFAVDYNTLFLWAVNSNYPSYFSDNVEKLTQRGTPRRFDSQDDPEELGLVILAVATDGSYYVPIDFISNYNPLFYYSIYDISYDPIV